jgi:hypothetical protein
MTYYIITYLLFSVGFAAGAWWATREEASR